MSDIIDLTMDSDSETDLRPLDELTTEAEEEESGYSSEEILDLSTDYSQSSEAMIPPSVSIKVFGRWRWVQLETTIGEILWDEQSWVDIESRVMVLTLRAAYEGDVQRIEVCLYGDELETVRDILLRLERKVKRQGIWLLSAEMKVMANHSKCNREHLT
jgi:hypothetical protein